MTSHLKIDSASSPSGLRSGVKTLLTASVLGAAMLFSACSDSGTVDATQGAAVANPYEVDGDHAIGNPNATVTIVEYASVTCGHCANWHEAVWPELRKDYVDSGKVRFIYREFPTAPVALAEVGFLIANCAPEDKYFANIALQYEKQSTLINSAQQGRAKEEYTNLAKAAGLSEEEFNACIANEEEYERMQAVVQDGFEKGVTGTPSFFINGEKKSVFTIDDFDTELAALGIDVPERNSDDEPADESGH